MNISLGAMGGLTVITNKSVRKLDKVLVKEYFRNERIYKLAESQDGFGA